MYCAVCRVQGKMRKAEHSVKGVTGMASWHLCEAHFREVRPKVKELRRVIRHAGKSLSRLLK